MTLVIQVDGKTHDTIQVPAGLDQEQALERVKGRERVRSHLSGRGTAKVIYVPDRLINVVTLQRR